MPKMWNLGICLHIPLLIEFKYSKPGSVVPLAIFFLILRRECVSLVAAGDAQHRYAHERTTGALPLKPAH